MGVKEDDLKQDPEPSEPTGGPDWKRAANDYRAQRDQAREQVEQMQKQLDELKKSTEGLKTAEDVQKAVDEALAKANEGFETAKAEWAAQEKSLTVSGALAEAGCIDAPALLAHVDMSGVTVKDGKAEGIDLDSLKESYPYLFGKRPQAGSTDVKPSGAPEGIDDAIDSAMGV